MNKKLNRCTSLCHILLLVLAMSLQAVYAQVEIKGLPVYQEETLRITKDWLIEKIDQPTALYRTREGELVLSNGLISRRFSVKKGGATTGLTNLMTGENMLRSVRPEALVRINGIDLPVGGLKGQPVHNYLLDEWLEQMSADPAALKLQEVIPGETQARFKWKKRPEWMPKDRPWPAPGKSLTFVYAGDERLIDHLEARELKDSRPFDYLKGVKVVVHYEMYDGIPLISKWIEVRNDSGRSIMVNSFKSEILALAEPESAVDAKTNWIKPNISIETDFRFGGMSNDNLYSTSIAWNPDSLYKTQVNYELTTPVLLEAYPKLGPEKLLQPGEKLESFRTWELFHDSWDRERKGLAERRMYRSQAPWITENPIMMHVRNADNASVKEAIDQCAAVGFELVIMTFGSGFNIEDDSETNLSRMKALADYAHSKGVALGGYSLLASRSVSKEDDVVMPQGQSPRFGHSPCLGSYWGAAYFDKLYNFYEKTGQDMLEHDGSYPGDVCASHDHPGHKGLKDSQWNQYEKISTFYEWARSRGIFLNVPDHYYMAGSNKSGMGYRETNWSLPRAQQEIIERQNIYDGTWQKTPSMGWMFVPLVEYHGGGEAATIEPLKEHLPHYEQRLANLFGAGVQACYRGPRLYDSPETKAVVKKWVDFYKKYREVLDADIVHIRRPDGRDYDGILHVNPYGEHKGLVMLYNPLQEPIKKNITVNLYYTGLKTKATVIDQHENQQILFLERNYTVQLPVNIPANGWQWFVIR